MERSVFLAVCSPVADPCIISGVRKLQQRTPEITLEVFMDSIISTLLSIFFYPVNSYFVILPCMLCFVSACFALVWKIIKGKF